MTQITMANLFVVIPSGNRRQYLQDIIDNCGIPKRNIIIINTDKNIPVTELPQEVQNMFSDKLNIYHWWNLGIKSAQKQGATHVAVLNDDLELIDNPLQKILDLMVQEDATIGHPLPASSNPCGYCFILNLEHGVFPDEKYRWWYGDNDLFKRAKKVIGVRANVKHLEPNRLTSESADLMELAKRDKEIWEKDNGVS